MHLTLRQAARGGLRAFQIVVPGVGTRAHILAYHLVGGGTMSRVDIPLARFERDLEAVRGRVVRLDDLVEGAADPGSVVLTFDDAYANFYETVYPMLVERRLPATLYVPTGFVDGSVGPPMRGTKGLRACTWAQLREMANSGLVTLGGHGVTHQNLTSLKPAAAEWEIATSRARIEQEVGRPVRHFCYPRSLWNPAMERIVAAHYETAVVGGGGATAPGRGAALRLQRNSVRSDSPTIDVMTADRVWLEERVANASRRVRDRLRLMPQASVPLSSTGDSGTTVTLPAVEPTRKVPRGQEVGRL